MDLKSLNVRRAVWLDGGPDGDVVLSSRVRIARNLDGFPFVSRCSDAQRARIEELARNVVLSLPIDRPLHYVRLDELTDLYRELLLERHLIGREVAEGHGVRAIAFDDGEHYSVTVNAEDHLRVRCTGGGLSLEDVYESADRLDDMLAARIPFAFSDQYGYLTASPLNVGTGLRASVMLHLPGVVMAHEMDRLAEIARQDNLAVRGTYGEGTHGAGDFYQVCNQVTLGLCEEVIVSQVGRSAKQLCELERSCRSNLHASHPGEFCERIEKAYELLCSAAALSSQETLNLLSLVRLGVEMGLLRAAPMATINDLFFLTLPAHLQTMEGGELDSAVRNELRASYVRNRLVTG